METGFAHLVMNLHKHLMNALAERSGVGSRCSALEVAQVNKQI